MSVSDHRARGNWDAPCIDIAFRHPLVCAGDDPCDQIACPSAVAPQEPPDLSVAPSPPLPPLFHPAVAAWFDGRFGAPTPAQAQAWPAIRSGHHTLIAAPTGSGKTLAAFLAAIDQLVRQGMEGRLPDETQIVYVSPLKALSNDIQRNLDAPLAGIRAELQARGAAACRDPRLGPDRRYAGRRACPDASAARRISS